MNNSLPIIDTVISVTDLTNNQRELLQKYEDEEPRLWWRRARMMSVGMKNLRLLTLSKINDRDHCIELLPREESELEGIPDAVVRKYQLPLTMVRWGTCTSIGIRVTLPLAFEESHTAVCDANGRQLRTYLDMYMERQYLIKPTIHLNRRWEGTRSLGAIIRHKCNQIQVWWLALTAAETNKPSERYGELSMRLLVQYQEFKDEDHFRCLVDKRRLFGRFLNAIKATQHIHHKSFW